MNLFARKKRQKPTRLTHDFFIVISSYKFLTSEEIESSRRLLKRLLKRKAEIEVMVRSFLPRTKKPAEVRMGKGKGKISQYVSVVRPGQFYFRIRGVTFVNVREAFLALCKKASVSLVLYDFAKYLEWKRSKKVGFLSKN